MPFNKIRLIVGLSELILLSQCYQTVFWVTYWHYNATFRKHFNNSISSISINKLWHIRILQAKFKCIETNVWQQIECIKMVESKLNWGIEWEEKSQHFIDSDSFISICRDLINQIGFLCSKYTLFFNLLELFLVRFWFTSKIDTLNSEAAAVLNVGLN